MLLYHHQIPSCGVGQPGIAVLPSAPEGLYLCLHLLCVGAGTLCQPWPTAAALSLDNLVTAVCLGLLPNVQPLVSWGLGISTLAGFPTPFLDPPTVSRVYVRRL